MTKSEFLQLLENAKQDKHGNLYFNETYADGSKGARVYFATVSTACDDFVENYCYKCTDGSYEHYNHHFMPSDDTFEVKIVKRDVKKK